MSAAMRWPFTKKLPLGPTICPVCDSDIAPGGDRCPCGYCVPHSTPPEPVQDDPSTWAYWKRRGISRAACDFCNSPWVEQWVDVPGGGRRSVCEGHRDPRGWPPEVPVSERLSERGLLHASEAPGVRVWKGAP